jgi:hypothetical protein
VVGLATWELAKGGIPVEGIVRAATPEEAVARAMELARRPPAGSFPDET